MESELKCERCNKTIDYIIKYPMPYHLCKECFDYMIKVKKPDERFIPANDDRMKNDNT